ncbi:primary-amine oxidase [Trebonia kvetii]|uniref:Amine oxidase n=1 Tax=Trebonia kvetii TaxID=2480626 RepID=A0A6P2BXJ3_9ACTN|nr:primary-amine oxidase [Trebonia kvetii]
MPHPYGKGPLVSHPLDPLTADEIRRVAGIVRRDRGVGEGWRFASIELREPDKTDLPALDEGRLDRREAIVVCWNRADGQAYRAVVSLTGDAVSDWEHLPGQQPNMTVDEWHECDAMLRSHPAVLEALARRGVTDLSRVLADMWAYGAALVPDRYVGRRIGWCDVWYRGSERGNPYAHHLTGLHPIVDLNTMTLLELEDSGPAGDDVQIMGEYLPDLLPMRLREVAPLHISQPDGPGFALDGTLLSWQNWRLRLGFNHREGLVLHQVAFSDGGRLRSVAHRLSFAEMVVPYRDASPDHYRRTAFDIGEWGLGFMTTSLTLGCDCLGEITYLDAVVHDSKGEPVTIPNAICVHEEDSGVLWKHVDERAGAEVRRARRLVISFHVTVANYEYLVYWRFYQDGAIECEVRATGIMVTSHTAAPGSRPANGTLVDQGIYAPFHQHFIVARLDLDVDGPGNTVYVTESRPAAPGDDDPHALGLTVSSTPLRTESEGRQDYDWASQRGWKVVNDTVRNAMGTPVGYKLVPAASFPALLDPASPAYQRAKVIGHTLWVTPYRQDERWPCGDFPVQADADTGLPAWTAADRPIENTDVVLWYVFGIHHITRPEDWPVMPSDIVSFWLKPFGFFDRNPALDVPPSHRH